MKHLTLVLLMSVALVSTAFSKAGNSAKCSRLGCEIAPIDNTAPDTKLKDKNGVLVTQIMPNSLAEKLHVAVGDIIQNINGQDILNATQLDHIMNSIKAGTTIELTVARNGKQKTLYTRIKG